MPFTPALAELDPQFSAELDGASWAVVDFAPGDAAWCDWLYRNINGYPVPTPLIDRKTPHGFARPGCLSIFPDRRDPQHEEHYPTALAQSKYLILVCSPRSAHEAACDEEIRVFKSAGGEERIIALLVEGEPDVALDRQPRPATADWLPPWLRWRMGEDGAFVNAERSEPRIIDARPGVQNLQEVRDELLAALLETRSDQLAVMGGLSQPVEFCLPTAALSPAPKPAISVPVALPEEHAAKPIRSRAPALIAAALFASLAAAAAIWWPKHPQHVEMPRVQIVAEKVPAKAHIENTKPPIAALQEPAPVSAPIQSVAAPVAQVAPAKPIEPPVAPVAPEPPAPSAELALREVAKSLHSRGDRAIAERHPDQALEYYAASLEAARSYAAQPSVDTAARAEVAILSRKLGTLQARYASTAEARASFDLGRKTLMRLKARGGWKGEHQRLFDELETGMRSLPRD